MDPELEDDDDDTPVASAAPWYVPPANRPFESGARGFTPEVDDPPDGRPVAYSTRGPRDVVISGPVASCDPRGRGTRHRTRAAARAAMIARYGEDRVVEMPQNYGRWSFLIKNLRQEVTT